ncbi:MAG: oxidoreductase, partial [Pseudomonadota bacterium]
RIVNISSAAQAPVDLKLLRGERSAGHMDAYSQSKLALIMWTRALAAELGSGPVVVAVNPGSLLATNMVREGFGIAGNDQSIGTDILVRAVVADEFRSATGQYFDNDSGRFADPHHDALDPKKVSAVMAALDAIIEPFMP